MQNVQLESDLLDEATRQAVGEMNRARVVLKVHCQNCYL